MFHKAKKINRQVVSTQSIMDESSELRSSVSRKQLLTVLVLFWTLLGCALPNFAAILVQYIVLKGNFQNGIPFAVFLYIIT